MTYTRPLTGSDNVFEQPAYLSRNPKNLYEVALTVETDELPNKTRHSVIRILRQYGSTIIASDNLVNWCHSY